MDRIFKWSLLILLLITPLIFSGGLRADSVGIVYARQFPEVLSTLTGISPLEQEIHEFYTSNFSKLPSAGQISEITPSFFITELSYSSLYCQRFVHSEKGKASSDRWAFTAVDFSKPFSQFKDLEVLKGLVSGLSLQIWGRALTPEELAILTQEISDWASDSEATQLANLEQNLVSLCAVYLSSPALWMEAP